MLLQKGYHRILGAFGIKEKKEEEPITETGRQRQYHRTGCKRYFSHLLGNNIYHSLLKIGHDVVMIISGDNMHMLVANNIHYTCWGIISIITPLKLVIMSS